ncbi:hypothetical protein GCM10022236_42070 [Microlunatus ginsengisoli]|uniref:Uncharacterized protein n=1 Tax=Microlunatus ginsengisoli TaxID=363863 RepID=A0ABP7ALP7_9ACTN
MEPSRALSGAAGLWDLAGLLAVIDLSAAIAGFEADAGSVARIADGSTSAQTDSRRGVTGAGDRASAAGPSPDVRHPRLGRGLLDGLRPAVVDRAEIPDRAGCR